MAPPTKQVRMERALDLADKAAAEARRLEHVAAAARVKANIHIRRARRLGAPLRTIEAHTKVDKTTVDRICKGPEPTLPERERT